MIETTVIEGKKEFGISASEESILSSIRYLKDEYEQDEFVRYGTSPEFGDEDFTYIGETEYNNNVDKFEEEAAKYLTEEAMQEIIKNWPRKKNGTFNRRKVKELVDCANCLVIHEWHNTWIYYLVKVVAIDDYHLKLELYEKTDTPG